MAWTIQKAAEFLMVDNDRTQASPITPRTRSESRHTFFSSRSRTPSPERTLEAILMEHDVAHSFLQSANKACVKSGLSMGIDPTSRYTGMRAP